jgi:transposase
MTHMGKAVDTVRKREHWGLHQVGDETLAESKCLWLYSEENLPEKHWEGFEWLKTSHLKTARAIKESLHELWSDSRKGWASAYFKRWYSWAIIRGWTLSSGSLGCSIVLSTSFIVPAYVTFS